MVTELEHTCRSSQCFAYSNSSVFVGVCALALSLFCSPECLHPVLNEPFFSTGSWMMEPFQTERPRPVASGSRIELEGFP